VSHWINGEYEVIKKLAVLPVAVVTMVVLAGAGTASASARPPVHTGPAQVVIALGPARDVTAAEQRRLTRAGSTDCPKFTRTSACESRTGTIELDHNGQPVGEAFLRLIFGWHTDTLSRRFTANLTVETAWSTVPGPLGVTISALCEGSCSASGAVTGPVVPGGDFSGTLDFQDATTTRHTNRATFVLTPIYPGIPSTPGVGTSDRTVRCDQEIAQAAGCVLNAFTPTLTTMAGLQHIAINIATVQAGGRHLGRPGDSHPLHRITDKTVRDSHRRQVCPKGRKPPHKGWECDEYPFASTAEGGTSVPPQDRGTAWVPGSEQRSQGGELLKFIKQERVLNNDAYYVEV